MKDGFRKSMSWLHTWTGLIVGWVLFFIFITGTAGYYSNEITRWMQPEKIVTTSLDAQHDEKHLIDLGLTRLEQVAKDAKGWRINLPYYAMKAKNITDFSISWETLPLKNHKNGQRFSERLNTIDGKYLARDEVRETAGGRTLYKMHYRLRYLDSTLARTLVVICSLIMLVAIISGIIVHKKIFTDFFTFRPGKGQRSWLDAHNIFSVMSLPFFLMITFTGLVYFVMLLLPEPLNQVYGKDLTPYYDELLERDNKQYQTVIPPDTLLPTLLKQVKEQWGDNQIASITIQNPSQEPGYIEFSRIITHPTILLDDEKLRFDVQSGAILPLDKPQNAAMMTRNVLTGLHDGDFAHAWLRLLYFLSGLMGCAVIATGLILWTVKRRKQHEKGKVNIVDYWGLKLVEALNVSTIIGLPIAIAAFFWSNRLLPIELGSRASWEINCLFIAWAWCFAYTIMRPIKKAWLELMYLACAAFALIPVVNALTTERNLLHSLREHDWIFVGFELTMLLFAGLFAYAAVKTNKKWLLAGSSQASKPTKKQVESQV